MTQLPADPIQLKRQIRAEAAARREAQQHKDRLSREICRRLAELPEYVAAGVVMFYVDFGPEVRTRPLLPTAWQQGKQVVVPCCCGQRLELFRLEDLDELVPGTHRIPEPRLELRGRPERKVDLAELDLIAVPGLAFDRRGGRIGHGKGYYDRLLRQRHPGTVAAGLAFECQLFDRVPMLPHDVYVDKVITERGVYRGRA